MSTHHAPPPRIVRIKYRSGRNGRVAIAHAKIEYSGLYALNDRLARLFSKREIRWFRVEEVPAPEIAAIRNQLVRWPEALAQTVGLTKINLEV